MVRSLKFFSALLVLIFPAVALCGHYGLEATGLMDSDQLEKAAKAGITDTAELHKATATKKGRRDLVRRMGVKSSVTAGWHDFCDLLRLDGVGPKVARLMTAGGVKNLKDLAMQKPASLLKKLKANRSAVPEMGKFPNKANLGSWIYRADEILKADRKAQKK